MTQHIGFYVTFEVVTPESAEHGEAERIGWWDRGWEFDVDDKPDEPAHVFDEGDFDPDEHDDIGEARIEWAVSLLKSEGATEASCHPVDDADWWTSDDGTIDYATGETMSRSFHFHGFSDDEIAAINKQMKD